jgi:hypothetical protein
MQLRRRVEQVSIVFNTPHLAISPHRRPSPSPSPYILLHSLSSSRIPIDPPPSWVFPSEPTQTPMDRLISLEPSNLVAVRIEHGHKCSGELTLRNVMYTMPVAFRLQPLIKTRYTVRPQAGIISPLATLTIEIVYHLPPGSNLPHSFPLSDDAFLLHSVVVPGAAIKEPSSMFDAVPNDWFTTKKKQVFIVSGIKIIFVGPPVLAQLVADGSMDDIRDVLEKSELDLRAVDSVDVHGQTLLHLAIAQSRADLVQLLLEFEPDVEAQNRSGSSPLEAATAAGESLTVELLWLIGLVQKGRSLLLRARFILPPAPVTSMC